MANLAALARPLTVVTRKDRTTGSTVQFKWDRQCEEAFKTLKERLTTAPILRPLIFQKSSLCVQMQVRESMELC